jgi:hypothetical protein
MLVNALRKNPDFTGDDFAKAVKQDGTVKTSRCKARES